MIVTDPRQFDNPIVFANDAFLKLTGYSRLEVAGRNCRFLQGPADTDPAAVDRIRDAVRDEVDIKIDLLNYRKDGSTFHNALYIARSATRTERSSTSSPLSSTCPRSTGSKSRLRSFGRASRRPKPSLRNAAARLPGQGRVRKPMGSRPG